MTAQRQSNISATSLITKELVESVRAVTPIERIAEEHTQLRRSGPQLIGRCPLHSEKTPSFSVHPGKRVYRCHGCGAGGDVFDFVARLHGCSFREAVQFLATRSGIQVEGFKPSPELSARVAAEKARRGEQEAFARFCDERIWAINRHCRDLGQIAAKAERYLQSGKADPNITELAWMVLEQFRAFEARIEREGLVDVDILRAEWARKGAHQYAA